MIRGFPDEKTKGAVGSGELAAKRKKGREPKAVGGATLGLADITTGPRGDPSVSAPLGPTVLQQREHPSGTCREERDEWCRRWC